MVLRYANPWLVAYREAREAELRLFCFPFAGGGVRVFRDWPKHLPPNLEILTVQLPGRGNRINEPLMERWEDLLPSLGEAMEKFLDKPFAFFGHSLGALIAFEMTRHLRRRGRPVPQNLFVSAAGAPQTLRNPEDPLHILPDAELLDRAKKWGGVPPEIMKYPEALPLFVPPLRADLTLLETYQYKDEPPLPVSIDAFGGRQDPHVSPAVLEDWRQQTREKFLLTMVEGGHFYIEEGPEPLWRFLNEWAAFRSAYNSFW